MADSKEVQTENNERAKLSLDLDGLGAGSVHALDPAKIEALSVATGFSSRAKPAPSGWPGPIGGSRGPGFRKRRTTGRTHPFNTKIKPEAYEHLVRLADRLSEVEERPVSMAEILERALVSFEAALKA